MIPRKTGSPARGRGLAWLLLGFASLALLSSGDQIVGFYTDWLWFDEVQFTSVFVTVLQTQVLLGVVTGAAFFLILYGNVILARRLASREVLVAVDDARGVAQSGAAGFVPAPAGLPGECAASPSSLAGWERTAGSWS